MGDGLLDMLGLGESNPPEPVSEAQSESSSVFRDAIAAVNETLQSAVTSAMPQDHAALDADRSKLYQAYQVASSQFSEDDDAGKQAMDRVIAAAGSLGSKAANAAAASAAAQQQWSAKQESFDEMVIRVGELEEAGHPKADTLRQVTDTIREKANSRNYNDSAAAVEELGPKLAAIMQEQQALMAQAEAAQADKQESSWWDKTTNAVSDWFSSDDEGEEAQGSLTTGGKTGQAIDENGEEKSWWDKASDAVDDAYDWVTGEDDDSDEKNGSDETKNSDDAPDDKTTIGGPPEDEDDLWWHELQAVIARSDVLNGQRRDLEAISEKSDGGKMADPGRESLAQEIMAFSQECDRVRNSWSEYAEDVKSQVVYSLEDEAAVLETFMKQYLGELSDYDKKFEERAAIIARSIAELQGQVQTAEALLKRDRQHAENIKQGIANQQIVGAFNLTLGIVGTGLSLFPPTAILGSALSAAQMAVDPNATGAAGLANDLAGEIGKSNSFISKVTPVSGAVLNAYSVIDQAYEDRQILLAKYEALKAALARVDQSNQALIGLMQQFNTKMAQAINYANKATGVSH